MNFALAGVYALHVNNPFVDAYHDRRASVWVRLSAIRVFDITGCRQC